MIRRNYPVRKDKKEKRDANRYVFLLSTRLKVNANDLIESYYRASATVRWKESVQRYEINLLENIYKTKKRIEEGTYEPKPFAEFKLCERGRQRWIKSHNIEDRVVQRYVCDYIVLPKIQSKLYYKNGASLRGKGISFQRREFENDIHKYYRKHGRNGYIVLGDFSKFFDNIEHEKALDQFRTVLDDEEFELVKILFKAFEVDLSFLTDEEFELCKEGIYNALDYQKPKGYCGDGSKILMKSVGIGSQLSQLTGVFFPTSFDNYMTCVMGCKYYGRYADDFYAIVQTKDEAKKYIEIANEQAEKLGLYLNKKKTRIVHLEKEFTFLKVRYIITPSGKMIRKIPQETLRREKNRLRKFKKKELEKKMTVEQIEQCYKSWRGTYSKFDSGYKIKNMDEYFNKLFKGGMEDER